MRRITSSLLFVLLTITFAAVPQKQGRTQTTSEKQTSNLDNGVTAKLSRSSSYRLFKGAIDDRYDFQAYLQLDGQKVMGSYFFTRPKPFTIKRFDLKGSSDNTGNIILDEVESVWVDGVGEKEKLTRTFEGEVTGDLQTGYFPVRMAGTWLNRNERKLFVLEEQTFSLGKGINLITEQASKEYKRLNYEINVSYPQVSGSNDPRILKFNKASKALVFKVVNEFKKDCAESAQIDDLSSISPETGKPIDKPLWSLFISWDVVTMSKNLLSVTIDEETYTGGAHGQHARYVINYDLSKGRVLQLADVFKPKSSYLQTLSRACRDVLKQSKGDNSELIHEGTAPTPANYKAWNLTPYGFMVLFGDYQVDGYSGGRSEVVVPYNVFKSTLQPSILELLPH